jgi:DNA-binding GntR family transcriptional regulator
MSNLPRIDQVSLRERAHRVLQRAIVRGELPPGTRLRDQELAEQMGLSRTPVREALQRLEDEGLVQTAARSQTVVAPLEARTAREAFPVVAALHALAAREAAPAWRRVDSAALQAANEALLRALQTGDAEAGIAADDAFHGVFVARAQNGELASVLEGLMPKVRRLEWLQFSSLGGRASVAQHAQIIEEVGRGGDGVARLVEENWLSLGSLIVNSLQGA